MSHIPALFNHANYQARYEEEKYKLFNTPSPMGHL